MKHYDDICLLFSICQMKRFLSLLSSSNQQRTRQKTNGVFLPAELLPFHLRVEHGAAPNRLRTMLYITIGQMYKMCIFYFLMAYEYLTAGVTQKNQPTVEINIFFSSLNGNLGRAFSLTKNTMNYPELNLLSTLAGRERKGAAVPDSAECVREREPEFLCKCARWRSCVHGWFTGWILFPCSLPLLLCWLQSLSVHCAAWYRQDLHVTVHILLPPAKGIRSCP